MRLPITRHGYPVVAVVLAACLALAAGTAWAVGWYALLLAVPAVFTLYFFRDPERRGDDSSPEAVLAPADGKIVAVRQSAMPFEDTPAVMIDIFLSIFDVHINRTPVAGRVVRTEYQRGRFRNALFSDAGEVNENNTVLVEDERGIQIAVRQIAGVIARRIVCSAKEGDVLSAGERIGMIRFGSRTQVFIPAGGGFEPCVAAGDRVKAGQTVLGRIG